MIKTKSTRMLARPLSECSLTLHGGSIDVGKTGEAWVDKTCYLLRRVNPCPRVVGPNNIVVKDCNPHETIYKRLLT